jgi:hypothetical protein
MPGGVLSPVGQKRIRRWPYAFRHLGERGDAAFLDPCRRMWTAGVARNDPPRTPQYFEGELGELDAKLVDARAAPAGRGHTDGMTRLGGLLPGAMP